jgi:hypothetical protein
MLVAFSPADAAGGAEGDDLILVLELECSDGKAIVDLGKLDPYALQSLLNRVNAYLGQKLFPDYRVAASRCELYPVGSYLLEYNEAMEIRNCDPLTVSLLIAYLYYCYLMCVRCERLINGVQLDRDWLDEAPRVLLAKRRLLNAKRFALIKHRSKNPQVVDLFKDLLERFRLPEQLHTQAEMSRELEGLMRASSEYDNTLRQHGLEVVLKSIAFVSFPLTITASFLAIPMAPFFAEGKNVISEHPYGMFWLLLIITLLLPLSMWLWLRMRRWVQRHWGHEKRPG